jgi:hypothetical protein
MTKNKKGTLVVAAAIILIAIGVGVYLQANEGKQANFCETILNKQVCTDDYLGLSQGEAEQKAISNQLTPKIRSIDGNTDIPHTNRGGELIFFTIENGKVSKVEFK